MTCSAPGDRYWSRSSSPETQLKYNDLIWPRLSNAVPNIRCSIQGFPNENSGVSSPTKTRSGKAVLHHRRVRGREQEVERQPVQDYPPPKKHFKLEYQGSPRYIPSFFSRQTAADPSVPFCEASRPRLATSGCLKPSRRRRASGPTHGDLGASASEVTNLQRTRSRRRARSPRKHCGRRLPVP